jgi:predicted peptidase
MKPVHAAFVLVFSLINVFGTGCAGPQPMQTGLLFKSVRVGDGGSGGVDRAYAVYVPRGYDPAKPWPAIVFLNGSGECGTDGQRQTAVGLAPAVLAAPERWPFVIIFPQKPDQPSPWWSHEALVLSVLDEAKRDYRLDPGRIYLTGLSQGGAGTWVIGTRHPELFAALAPVCGYGEVSLLGESIRGLPIRAFHGEADDVVPSAKTKALAARAEELGAKVEATYYPGVNHNSWDKAYREEGLERWFLEHGRR